MIPGGVIRQIDRIGRGNEFSRENRCFRRRRFGLWNNRTFLRQFFRWGDSGYRGSVSLWTIRCRIFGNRTNRSFWDIGSIGVLGYFLFLESLPSEPSEHTGCNHHSSSYHPSERVGFLYHIRRNYRCFRHFSYRLFRIHKRIRGIGRHSVLKNISLYHEIRSICLLQYIADLPFGKFLGDIVNILSFSKQVQIFHRFHHTAIRIADETVYGSIHLLQEAGMIQIDSLLESLHPSYRLFQCHIALFRMIRPDIVQYILYSRFWENGIGNRVD